MQHTHTQYFLTSLLDLLGRASLTGAQLECMSGATAAVACYAFHFFELAAGPSWPTLKQAAIAPTRSMPGFDEIRKACGMELASKAPAWLPGFLRAAQFQEHLSACHLQSLQLLRFDMEEPLDYACLPRRPGEPIQLTWEFKRPVGNTATRRWWYLLGPGTSRSMGGTIQNQSQSNHGAPTSIMTCRGLAAQLVAACLRPTNITFVCWSAAREPCRAQSDASPANSEVSASSTTVGQICQSLMARIESSIHLLVVLIVP